MRLFIWAMAFPLLASPFSLQFRGGYFYPAAELIQDVYDTGGGDYETEIAAKLHRNLSGWMNFNYFFRKGHTIGFDRGTFIRIFPLSLGLKYKFLVTDVIDFYIGVGPTYTWVRIHDDVSHRIIWRQAGGIVGKTGFLYYLPHPRLFFDIYFDYYYTHISQITFALRPIIKNEGVNIGGLRGGAGLGIFF
ncbi:MAG TPA: hypothetical protein VLE89_05425 [Chlamydiales bacterium]|nr:hypothetical protein [Chlamydiales bacterium]